MPTPSCTHLKRGDMGEDTKAGWDSTPAENAYTHTHTIQMEREKKRKKKNLKVEKSVFRTLSYNFTHTWYPRKKNGI